MDAVVILSDSLRKYLPEGKAQILSEAGGRTVGDLLFELGIPRDLVGVIMVNGQLRPDTYLIRPGNEIRLLSFVGGG